MSAISKIEWTERTWNPVRGCSLVSPGCHSCYAMKQAHRFSGPGKTYHGLTKLTERSGPQWTGKVVCDEGKLLEPLSWRKPCRVFVNSMSDLFHEDVPFEFIDKVFAVMALAPRHTFQVLTKRAGRMREYFDKLEFEPERIQDAAVEVGDSPCAAGAVEDRPWPLPNVWLGVSAEDQQRADERVLPLLATPAAVRFVSAEPLLGPVDFTACGIRPFGAYNRLRPSEEPIDAGVFAKLPALDWVIVGGESGPGARPFDTAWARSIVQQCKAAGVACFVKQLGANPDVQQKCGDCDPCIGGQRCYQQYNVRMSLNDRKGGDPSEWPEDLRVREYPASSSGVVSAPPAEENSQT